LLKAFAFALPTDLVDNSYGPAGSIGWGSIEHFFKHLEGGIIAILPSDSPANTVFFANILTNL
jgi:hypothetical protein